MKLAPLTDSRLQTVKENTAPPAPVYLLKYQKKTKKTHTHTKKNWSTLLPGWTSASTSDSGRVQLFLGGPATGKTKAGQSVPSFHRNRATSDGSSKNVIGCQRREQQEAFIGGEREEVGGGGGGGPGRPRKQVCQTRSCHRKGHHHDADSFPTAAVVKSWQTNKQAKKKTTTTKKNGRVRQRHTCPLNNKDVTKSPAVRPTHQ